MKDGGREGERMRGRKKLCLFSSPSASTATMKTKLAVSTTASIGT